MGLILQMLGVAMAIVSLICSIIALRSGAGNAISLFFLFVGVFLVKLGRRIYRDKK